MIVIIFNLFLYQSYNLFIKEQTTISHVTTKGTQKIKQIPYLLDSRQKLDELLD